PQWPLAVFADLNHPPLHNFVLVVGDLVLQGDFFKSLEEILVDGCCALRGSIRMRGTRIFKFICRSGTGCLCCCCLYSHGKPPCLDSTALRKCSYLYVWGMQRVIHQCGGDAPQYLPRCCRKITCDVNCLLINTVAYGMPQVNRKLLRKNFT